MVDDLIREITEPPEDLSATGKAAARKRLLAAQPEAHEPPKQRLGGRGLLVLLALVAVPTGVAVATEMSRDGEQGVRSVSECPDLLAAAQQRGIKTGGLFTAGCPVGSELDQTVLLLEKLQQRREEIEGDEETIGVVGGSPDEKSSAEGSWGLWGIAGPAHRELP